MQKVKSATQQIEDQHINPVTHPLLADEGVNLRNGDDLGHEHAQPLWVEEVELAELGL